MNRDAILATCIGLGLGLLITGVLLIGPQIISALPHISLSIPKLAFPKTATKTTITPTPVPAASGVIITSPLTETIATDSQLVVSGTASPKAVVVIQGFLDDEVLSIGSDGKYAGKISLVEGKNDIVVSSYLNDKSDVQQVSVYYTPESF